MIFRVNTALLLARFDHEDKNLHQNGSTTLPR